MLKIKNFGKFASKYKRGLVLSGLGIPIASTALHNLKKDDDKELVQVFWTIRHGWRTPISFHTFDYLESLDWKCLNKDETDEFRDKYLSFTNDGERVPKFEPLYKFEHEHKYGNCHRGQLTLLGGKQVYEVGRHAKELYIDRYGFLEPDFDPNTDLFVRSTRTGRTVETAYQFVNGLGSPKLHEDGFKLNINSYDIESMLARTSYCPKIHKFVRKLRGITKTETSEDISRIFNPDKLDENVYKGIMKSSIGEICNNLEILKAHKEPLPDGIDEHHIRRACKLSGTFYYKLLGEDVLNTAIGKLLKEISDTFTNKVSVDLGKEPVKDLPTNSKKLVVAAGHDTTLFPLLISLGVFDGYHPPMASSVGIELWKNKEENPSEKDYYVKLLYNFKYLTIPECDHREYCPLERFVEITSQKRIHHFEKECLLDVENSQ